MKKIIIHILCLFITCAPIKAALKPSTASEFYQRMLDLKFKGDAKKLLPIKLNEQELSIFKKLDHERQEDLVYTFKIVQLPATVEGTKEDLETNLTAEDIACIKALAPFFNAKK